MQTSPRKRWTRDELMIVLNLYHKLPFGKMDSNQIVVKELAHKLGRSASSVSMKLCNLASFDPALRLRGVKGLEGASKLDREVWDEFHANLAEMIALSQERFDGLFIENEDECTEVIPGTGIRRVRKQPNGATEAERTVKPRRGQDYFRDIVLNNYDNCCGVTGLPIRELLVASHILPWSRHETERLNVSNGIALNRLFDAAFDRKFISFDDNLKLIFLPPLLPYLKNPATAEAFTPYESKPLQLPPDAVPPDLRFLELHRVGEHDCRFPHQVESLKI